MKRCRFKSIVTRTKKWIAIGTRFQPEAMQRRDSAAGSRIDTVSPGRSCHRARRDAQEWRSRESQPCHASRAANEENRHSDVTEGLRGLTRETHHDVKNKAL